MILGRELRRSSRIQNLDEGDLDRTDSHFKFNIEDVQVEGLV